MSAHEHDGPEARGDQPRAGPLPGTLDRSRLRGLLPALPSDPEESRRARLFALFTVIVLVPLVGFGAVHTLSGAWLWGLTIFTVVAALVVSLFLLTRLTSPKPAYRFAQAALMAILTYWTYTGTIQGFGSLWILAAPPFTFFLMGRKEGMIWAVGLGLVTAAIFFNPFSLLHPAPYPADYSLRHLSVFVLVLLITYFYETARMEYRQAVVLENAALLREKARAEEAIETLEDLNERLNAEMQTRKAAEEDLRRAHDGLEVRVAERTEELLQKNLELEQSEKRYRLLADNVSDLIWSMDINLRLDYISPSVTKMLGYSVQEALALPLERWHTPESLALVQKTLAEQTGVERDGTGDPNRYATLRLQHLRKDGTVVEVESTVRFLRDGRSRPIGVMGVTRDVTERVRSEREKEKVQQQLAQAQKMEAIGTLAAGIAHDFNNFLGGIVGSFELLKLTLRSEQLRSPQEIDEYLRLGSESASRSANLVKRLLTVSQKHEVALAPMDVNVCIQHIHSLCSNSLPKSVELDFRVANTPLMIMGDLVQIEQVLLNVCINASHAMTTMRPPDARQGGLLSVDAEQVESDELLAREGDTMTGGARSWIRVRVSDNGVGMTDDIRKRVFEPFFSTKQKHQGSGLGLSTSYNIVQKHGGQILVSSQPGLGTRFSIYLPAVHPVADRPAPGRLDRDDRKGTGTILVIDDEQSILDVVKGYLEHAGYTVICALGASQGATVFEQRSREISAVIIDYSMPEATGIEIFARLRRIDPEVRAILASGMIDSETQRAARELGIKNVLRKPFDLDALREGLKSIGL